MEPIKAVSDLEIVVSCNIRGTSGSDRDGWIALDSLIYKRKRDLERDLQRNVGSLPLYMLFLGTGKI